MSGPTVIVQQDVEDVFVSLGDSSEDVVVRVCESACGDLTGVLAEVSTTLIADETVSALRVVQQQDDGTIIYAQPTAHEVDRVVGVTTLSATVGGEVRVVRDGTVNVGGLGLALGRVWLGDDGVLTQVPPEGEVSLLIGFVTSSNTLVVSVFEPVFL